MMGNDFSPYYCRVGDQAPADGPFIWGRETSLVELPFTWGLDDFPAFELVMSHHGVIPGLDAALADVRNLGRRLDSCTTGWKKAFTSSRCIRSVSQRPSSADARELFVNHIRNRSGVTFKTMSEVALEFRKLVPPQTL